jgi:hypothetical protein
MVESQGVISAAPGVSRQYCLAAVRASYQKNAVYPGHRLGTVSPHRRPQSADVKIIPEKCKTSSHSGLVKSGDRLGTSQWQKMDVSLCGPVHEILLEIKEEYLNRLEGREENTNRSEHLLTWPFLWEGCCPASPITMTSINDTALKSGKDEGREDAEDISEKLVGVDSELGLMNLSEEISGSLLDASLSKYQ